MANMWGGIVDNAAGAVGHSGLASAMQSMFPGMMQGGGQPPQQMAAPAQAGIGGMPQPMMPQGGAPQPMMPQGGIAGYAEGGPVSPLAQQDPRIGVIANAEDALGHAEDGNAMNNDHLHALQTFQDMFGPHALSKLHEHVKGGMSMRPRKGRLVVGEGGGKDDKIPAVVDGVKAAKLSNGEFVMPADAVTGAGGGDPLAGAQRLQQLSQNLAEMRPAKQTKADTLARLMPAAKQMTQLPLNVEQVG